MIGLVTHANSRFNRNGASVQQLHDLREELVNRGFQVNAVISDRNEFTERGEKLRLRDQVSAAYHQSKLESQWKRYLRGFCETHQGLQLKDYVQGVGMFVKRLFLYIKNRSIVNRLMNIDLSHLRLLREGHEADWVVILEDDAFAPSVADAAHSIGATIDALKSTDMIFVSLSESFTATSLGIEQIIEQAVKVDIDCPAAELMQVPLPITNTVCANLYSTEFAAMFRDSLEGTSLLPSYPIDWRLNKLLLEVSQKSIGCYWLRPGVFLQGSMR